MQTKVFRHFRYFQCKDENSPCKVEAKGGITILVDKSMIKENKLIVSYSICSKGDVFCKKVGRELAEQREGVTITYVRNSYKESFERAFPDLFNKPTIKRVLHPVLDTSELF